MTTIIIITAAVLTYFLVFSVVRAVFAHLDGGSVENSDAVTVAALLWPLALPFMAGAYVCEQVHDRTLRHLDLRRLRRDALKAARAAKVELPKA